MTDANKERRRRQANAIRVLASPVRMPQEMFTNTYQRRHVIVGDFKTREEVERTTQDLYCDECIEHDGGTLRVHTLFCTIDDDPLNNFWKLATLHCFGCGFEEIVPLDTPQWSADGRDLATRMDQVIHAKDPYRAHFEQVKVREDAARMAQQQIFSSALSQGHRALSQQSLGGQAGLSNIARGIAAPPAPPAEPPNYLGNLLKEYLGGLGGKSK